MLYAISNEEKISAVPGARGVCPDCNGEMLAKCGDKNIWHWAHLGLACESNKEGETDWHLSWKAKFPKEWCEVKVNSFRADVLTPDGTAIEFQNSPILLDDIRNREANYKKVVWVVNGTDLNERFCLKLKTSHYTFQWNHRRKWVEDLGDKTDRYIDIAGEPDLFKIGKTYGKRGWGSLTTKEDFIWKYRTNKGMLFVD